MSLPFSADQFFEVMRRYNEGMWPTQLALTAVALLAVAFAPGGGQVGGRLISALLAGLWAWSGIAYHLGYFADVNPAAPLFAALFVCGAALFAWHGTWHARLTFGLGTPRAVVLGFSLIAYALVGYPALAYALGHHYPVTATFGLPCPLTLFTAGMLVLLRQPYPRSVLMVPIAWALIGASAALLFGMYEDLALLVAAAVLGLRAFQSIPAMEEAA
jgi:hypothetical protein